MPALAKTEGLLDAPRLCYERGQVPVGQLAADAAELALDDSTLALKAESFRRNSAPPHEGQDNPFSSSELRHRISTTPPHLAHSYSYNGISPYLLLRSNYTRP